MLQNDLIKDIVNWSPNCTPKDWQEIYLKSVSEKSCDDSFVEITNYLTNGWVPMWKEWAKSQLQIDELSKYEIYVVPSTSFSAETILINEKPFVIIHHGLMLLLSFCIECDFLSLKLWRKCGTTRSGSHLCKRFDDLSRHIFHCYMIKPFGLPNFRRWLSESTPYESTIYSIFGAELFVILHEISHIRLGHLNLHFSDTNTSPLSWHQRELEADTEAIRIAKSSVMLITGACQFLWWYDIYQSWTNNYQVFHPSALARFTNLVSLVGQNHFHIKELLNEDLNSLSTVNTGLKQGIHNDFWLGELSTAQDSLDELMMIIDNLLD